MNAALRSPLIVALAALASTSYAGNPGSPSAPGKPYYPTYSQQFTNPYLPTGSHQATQRFGTGQFEPCLPVGGPGHKFQRPGKPSLPPAPGYDAQRNCGAGQRIVVTIDGRQMLVDEGLLNLIRHTQSSAGQWQSQFGGGYGK